MTFSTLAHQPLHRPGGLGTSEQFSSDFTVDGGSLLQTLVSAMESHADYVSCFVRGFDEFNTLSRDQLLVRTPPATESGRIALYVCPECFDLGCGAITVRVSRSAQGYTWSDFAYENGWEDECPLEEVGPFLFEGTQYEQAIRAAAAL